jgi:hypothetical protein
MPHCRGRLNVGAASASVKAAADEMQNSSDVANVGATNCA